VTDLLNPPALLGSTEPRLATPPLVPLTPFTSYGFDVIDFAQEIRHPLLPWQEVAVIRGGELLCAPECSEALGVHGPGCRPRFRVLLLMVSRQNGKTELPVVLSVYWQFRQKIDLTLGTSTQLVYAKESWTKAVNLVKRTPLLNDQHEPGRKWYRMTNGETESWTHANCRYKIAASNSEGGRSLSVRRAIADELRQHRTYEAWDALEPACSPLDAQIWCLSNAGDSRSTVLNDLQDAAREYIETGIGDPRLGLLEWSAPEDSDPEDVDALLQANPRVGYGLDLQVLLAGAARAKRLGGDALTGFLTERMCVRVKVLNPAIPPRAWDACKDPGDLLEARARIACCIDLTPDGQHATLAAAAVLDDGRVRVETIAEWDGPRAAKDLERDLPGWVERIGPRVVGWLPTGPAAAVAARFSSRPGRRTWAPRGTRIEEITSDVTAVCMGFGKEVAAGSLAHSDQDMLNAQVSGAERLWKPNSTWVFTRRGGGNVDAIYAVAGAAHLARTMPRRKEVSQRARGVLG
jgi:hypothetical protein